MSSPARSNPAGSRVSRWKDFWLNRPALLLPVAFVVGMGLLEFPLASCSQRATDGSKQVAKDGIPWRTDYAAGLAEATAKGKPALLDFAAGWCGPCQTMEREVWPQAQVRQRVTAGFVPIKVDVDTPDGAQVAARYGVQVLPTMLVLDRSGKTLNRTMGLLDADTLLAFLNTPGTAGTLPQTGLQPAPAAAPH